MRKHLRKSGQYMEILSEAAKPGRAAVFFDFDNTIATCDVFDDMLLHFGVDPAWQDLEAKWKAGKIGSRQCLEGQIKCMNVPRERLDKYLSRIKLDPYFKKILQLLAKYGIAPSIVSDNFDYMLKRILKQRDINITVYANHARLRHARLIPSFPHTDKKCPACAHCKKKNLLSYSGKNSIILYIGDGRSDRCPAKYADIVFAKGYLLKFCKEEKLPYIAFKTLKDVYNCLRGAFDER